MNINKLKVLAKVVMLSAFLTVTCAGCASDDARSDRPSETEENSTYVIKETLDTAMTQTNADMESNQEDNDIVPHVHIFEQEEVVVVPEVQEYTFEDAVQIGEVQKLVGDLPGTGLGTWYTVTVDGVEYYYANYDSRPEEYTLFGWSIVDDTYELANGLKVGMKEEDVLALYPDMAVIDFENNHIYQEVTACMGWNGIAYPRSYAGRDNDWDYEGKEYYKWTDQFDYIMVADINLNNVETLPIYLGLLIKDHVVAAITFYYPTAG